MVMNRNVTIFLVPFIAMIQGSISAGNSNDHVAGVSPGECKHGIFPQPSGGPFSVFIFCDDAAGVNIGIILTESGAGPGSIELTGTKIWDEWNTSDRFWQEKEWATDVVAFVWSPSLKTAYVATSSLYGDGGLFQLNLLDRTFKRIIPSFSEDDNYNIDSYYSSNIKDIDLVTNKMTIEFFYLKNDEEMIKTEEIIME